ncbi:hypothetical protein A6M57_1640 [Staphylococcus pseudintermedius]|nr:hypothetical protein SPSE_0364 [Staphylococcus pseudintermedius ED99]ANS88647.1 hypothetical protein A6M57_1640 [Staphylococcus pseudintermedius]
MLLTVDKYEKLYLIHIINTHQFAYFCGRGDSKRRKIEN